jgi:hypothetical protein
MNNFLSNNFGHAYDYIKNSLIFQSNSSVSQTTGNHNFKIVEKKRKVFYFSKYSLETSEILSIAISIKTLKENIFKTLLDAMKYCVYSKFNIF